MKTFVLMLGLLLLTGAVSAQQQPDTTAALQTPSAQQTPATETATPQYNALASMTPQDYLSLNLPPLQVLLDNARNAPQARYYEVTRDVEEHELKTIRRDWINKFKLNANYSYGVGDIYYQNYEQDVQFPVASLSNSRQSRWNVGASFSMPLGDLTNRRNKIRQQQLRVDKTDYDKERWYDDLKLKIIDVYTLAIENFSILESAASTMTLARAQYTLAEAEFINGHADATTLSRQKSIENSAVREYEQIRSELNRALLQLEILTNTPILSRNGSDAKNK